MAVLNPDLSIDTSADPHTPPATGLICLGYLTSSVHHLRDRLGPSQLGLAPDGVTEAWVLHTPAGAAHLWAGTTAVAEELDVERRWLILAATDDLLPGVYGVLPWGYKAVHGSTAAFPTAALPHFTEATLHGFGHAYLDYLYLRMDAETGRRDQLDRTAPDFPTHLRRPRQINTMLLQLAEVLHHYEWAHASEAEREAWAGMQRSTPSEGLRYWKARNRWLYPPATGPHHSDPDLPGMLRALADTARDNRDSQLTVTPETDLALHDEHEQTLRALADVPIQGLDALQFPRG
ncbi:hypothetical protein [Actinophytocola xanthii]|uniref:Uncharacterized protein n=1 Tax=Actinophytocola xanthii TaxID=1912961 RepID=A0A1Q8CGG8_9PSEU|nr:hypothetical protein [Actinophytocola xanthii]OLF13491.1 hypothetical protein BU204_27230 [Actinophytocola xanthii]